MSNKIEKMLNKHTTKFLFWGFAAIIILGMAVNSMNYFGFIDLGIYVSGISSIILGLALFLEGGGISIFKYYKGGFSTLEIVHVITAFLGFAVVLGGVLQLMKWTIAGTPLGGILGFANAITILFVLVQMFVI